MRLPQNRYAYLQAAAGFYDDDGLKHTINHRLTISINAATAAAAAVT